MLLPSQVVYSFSSSPAARVGFHITRHLNRMRDHIRTALSLIRRGRILRPYFGKARHLITFLGFLSNPFQSPNLQGQTVSGSQKQNLKKTFVWLSSENPKECLGRCLCLACSRRRCKGFHSTHTITPGMINTTQSPFLQLPHPLPTNTQPNSLLTIGRDEFS